MDKKIPKPVKSFNHSEDLRKKYLNEWKDLFKSIHPEIEVYHFYDDEFNDFFKNSGHFDDDIDFGGLLYKETKILVVVPEELELSYIIGLSCNRMFSKREVLGDSFYWQEDGQFPCEPELFSWEKIYLDLCEISEELKKEIPEPIKSDKSIDHIAKEKYEIPEDRMMS